jgi:hypothetical protein
VPLEGMGVYRRTTAMGITDAVLNSIRQSF